jgi:dihydroorotase/N-acyl-D-amino-acid deacylase
MLKKTFRFVPNFLFIAAILCSVFFACEMPKESPSTEQIFSVILEGGTIFDGTGGDSVVADIGIIGERIAATGDLAGKRTGLRLDVKGLAVVPGFIDIHSHADSRRADRGGITLLPEAENELRQGVTTVIGGADGGSHFPLAEYFEYLEAVPAAINFGAFVGQGTIRRKVMGNEDRVPTAEDLDKMKALVEQAMREGAFGLSSGLKYVPGAYSKTEEVIELAKVAARYNGIYISHMRDEGLQIFESVEETIRIGEEGGLPAQITHHKIIGAKMWGKSVETLRLVDEARARGVDVSMDQYPYTASSTGIAVLMPRWSLEGDSAAVAARLRDPETRAKIKKAIIFNLEEDRGGGDPANVVVAHCAWDTSLDGMNLSEILRMQGRVVSVENAANLVMEIQEKGGASGIFHAMSEDDLKRIMQHPFTMHASDGGIPTPGVGVPHPRNYGTFPRVLGRYVREQKILSFSEAIRKMTSLPAWRLGLKDRGVLKIGAVADIAVLDRDKIIDRATFSAPHQYSEGVQHVFVSGKAALLNGELTGVRAGKVLRGTGR